MEEVMEERKTMKAENKDRKTMFFNGFLLEAVNEC
jgi:hypothetical protein